jgi:hypothetical protein
MTPLELARLFHQLAEASYKVAVWDEEERQMHEITMRALCIQAAVDETRRSAESDQDYMDGLAAMEWIKKRADELYAQIVKE